MNYLRTLLPIFLLAMLQSSCATRELAKTSDDGRGRRQGVLSASAGPAVVYTKKGTFEQLIKDDKELKGKKRTTLIDRLKTMYIYGRTYRQIKKSRAE